MYHLGFLGGTLRGVVHIFKMVKGAPSLDSLVSAVRAGSRLGREIGNALVPRGSRRARALSEGAKRVVRVIKGSGKKKRPPSRAPGPKPPKKRRKGQTKGYRLQGRGRIGPPFPNRAKYATVNVIQRQGYMIEYEAGGSVQDPAAVYVAQGFPARVVLESMCGSIVRKMFIKFGLEIKGWTVGAMTGDATDRFQWTIQHQTNSPGAVVNALSAEVNGSVTAANLAFALADLFMSITPNTQTYMNIVEIRCLWRRFLTAGPPATYDFREEYRVIANDLDITMYFKSMLTLQNRTNSVGGGADESSVLDVAHNPLVGKKYFGRGTHVNMKSMDGGADNRFLSINVNTGFNAVPASDLTTTSGARKLPYWNDLTNIYGSTGLLLAPGEIRDSFLYHKKTYKFAALHKMLFDFMRTAATAPLGTDQIMINFPVRVLGFEKKIDSRTAGQPDVVVAWQMNYTLGMMCTHKRRSAPLRLIAGL